MALISASTIIRSLSLFHITIAFFFLTSPKTVSDQTLVFIMGEAMGLPAIRAFDTPSAPLSFLAAILGIWGLTDLVAITQPPEIANHHWSAQAPVRLILFFALGVYSFVFSARSPLYKGAQYAGSAWGEGLKNRVVFTFAFIEMVTWFWVWTTLQDERREMALRVQERRAREAEDLL